MHRDPKRRAGNAVAGAALLLLVLCVALGGNYVRNTQIDEAQAKQNPYARYPVADLQVLAEGYRMELAEAERRHGGSRATARDRFHLSAQIKEFERVQKAARNNLDKALEIAAMRRDLQAIEAELQRRSSAGGEIAVHLTRLFRI
jgi:hypothetical protein